MGKEDHLLKKSQFSLAVFLLCILLSSTVPRAEVTSLEGTVWMYEHESGARHYIAFYGQYHYLNSSGFGQDVPDTLWLRSTSPYVANNKPDGSTHYRAKHISSGAWAINWGNCDITTEQATFSAFGMLYNFFVYNRNEPYLLIATDWSPPQLYTSSQKISPAFIEMVFPSIFGSGY
jgi:hypothetical protein